MTDVLDYLSWLFADYPTTFDIAWLAAWVVVGGIIGHIFSRQHRVEV